MSCAGRSFTWRQQGKLHSQRKNSCGPSTLDPRGLSALVTPTLAGSHQGVSQHSSNHRASPNCSFHSRRDPQHSSWQDSTSPFKTGDPCPLDVSAWLVPACHAASPPNQPSAHPPQQFRAVPALFFAILRMGNHLSCAIDDVCN